MDKENVVCIYTVECYSAIKKKEIIPFATTLVDPEGTMLCEMSKNDKYHIISLTRGFKKTKLTETENRLVVARAGGEGSNG